MTSAPQFLNQTVQNQNCPRPIFPRPRDRSCDNARFPRERFDLTPRLKRAGRRTVPGTHFHVLQDTRGSAGTLQAASPLTHVNKNEPPMLILHGTADKTVAVADSEALAAAMQAAGATHELVIIPDAPHSFHLQPKQSDLRPLVLGFFDKYLKGK